jgi:hypothetical protein
MRASFEPSVLEIAFLVGWTAYGAVRERIDRIRARFPGGAMADATGAEGVAADAPPGPVVVMALGRKPAPRVASVPARRAAVDYSIN